jgi:hypothetical protein
MLLGVALVLSSYWLAYSARADWQYSGVMNQPVWGRYHLLPQLGLSLFVAAGLPHWFAVDTLSGIPRRRAWALVGLVTALFLIQLPRGILAHAWHDPTAQQAALGEIERVDALCRAHQISAHAARSVLGWQSLPGCGDRENAWDLLRGSDTPRPLAEAEIRELLEAPQPATH